MAVRVELSNGYQLVTDMGLEEMHTAYQKALERNTVLDVKNGKGIRSINPMQIVLFEEIDDSTAEALKNGAPREASPA